MKTILASLALALLLTPSPTVDEKSRAAAPVAPGSVVFEVLFPSERENDDVQQYLLNKSSRAYPYISGGVIRVDWSAFDLGDGRTGTHTKYDFKLVDEAIAPWVNAGKFANLVLHVAPYGGPPSCPERGMGSNGKSGMGNCAMPAWMWTALGSSNHVECDGAEIPNFLTEAFQTNYKAAIAALVKHYEGNPGVGYIRVGLGKGGEINLPRGWQEPESGACGEAFSRRWGYTVGDSGKYTWNDYLQKMVEYEGSLNSAKQLMVSITPVRAPGHNPQEVADFLAPVAVKNGLGFGNQGLSAQAMRDCTGMQADWCNLFERFKGKVPLEVQTLGPSCPDGSECEGQGQGQRPGGGQGRWGGQRQGGWQQRQGGGRGPGGGGAGGGVTMGKLSNMTGPLPPLIPFAIKNHATIIEIYTVDWLIAFSPNHPQNRRFGDDYAQAIKQAAQGH